jgi:hypothetical protein
VAILLAAAAATATLAHASHTSALSLSDGLPRDVALSILVLVAPGPWTRTIPGLRRSRQSKREEHGSKSEYKPFHVFLLLTGLHALCQNPHTPDSNE